VLLRQSRPLFFFLELGFSLIAPHLPGFGRLKRRGR
jgi:hypothetical protein